jgi:hypothetical protein
MYPGDRGTKTLARSSFAGKDDTRKRFFWRVRLLQDRAFSSESLWKQNRTSMLLRKQKAVLNTPLIDNLYRPSASQGI